MDLLAFLATTGGRVVSKDEIIDAVWEGRFIAESTLTRSIADLRRALGDDQRCPQYIETIAKRGYRLVASIADAAGVPSHRRRRSTAAAESQRTCAGIGSRRAAVRQAERIPSARDGLLAPAGVSPTGSPRRGGGASSDGKRRLRSSARHCWPTSRPSWRCTSPAPAASARRRCCRSSRAWPRGRPRGGAHRRPQHRTVGDGIPRSR